MSQLSLIQNQPVICVPSSFGDDITPFDWFVNSELWQFSPTVGNVTYGAYGGVQFNNTDVGGYFDFAALLSVTNLDQTECEFYFVSVLVSGAYFANGFTAVPLGAVNQQGQPYVMAGLGWHNFILSKNDVPTLTFSFSADAEDATVEIRNIVIRCVNADDVCDDRFGDYCTPVLFSCGSDTSVSEIMAAIRNEWLAESSTYEDPNCVAQGLEELNTAVTTCEFTSEDIVIQYPAILGSDVVLNGGFESSSNWDIVSSGGRVTISSNHLNFLPGSAGTATCSQDCLVVGAWYIVTFTMSAHTAGFVQVFFGTNQVGSNVSANETYTFIGRCVGNGNLTFSATASTILDAKIDNVSANQAMVYEIAAVFGEEIMSATTGLIRYENDTIFQRFSISGNATIAEMQSKCFRLWLFEAYDSSTSQTYTPEFCLSQQFCVTLDACNTLLFTAVMELEGEAYGWQIPADGFQSIYALRMRIGSELVAAAYSGEVDSFQTSTGIMQVTYAESREFKLLKTVRVPEYVHDFLRLACRTDLFTITDADGLSGFYFTRSDDYSPSYIRTSKLAPVVLEVELREQNTVKNLCS